MFRCNVHDPSRYSTYAIFFEKSRPNGLCIGNNYYMENMSERTTKLFFTQARKVLGSEPNAANGRMSSRTPSRNVSAGAVSAEDSGTGTGKKKSSVPVENDK